MNLDGAANALRGEVAMRRLATVVALAANLSVSVVLWWTSGHLEMTVAALHRWVLASTVAAFSTLLVGAVLRRDDAKSAVGDGLLLGTLCSVVLDVLWFSLASAMAAD